KVCFADFAATDEAFAAFVALLDATFSLARSLLSTGGFRSIDGPAAFGIVRRAIGELQPIKVRDKTPTRRLLMQFIAEELHAHLLKCGHRDTAAPVSHYLQQKQLVAMVKLNNHPLWVKSRNISRCNRYVHFTPPKADMRGAPCPLWAKSGLMPCSKKNRYSITRWRGRAARVGR